MDEIMVVYWSQTGNTEAMANAVAEGIRKAGKDALVTEVSNISADALKDAGVFALGCPAMGAEVLEESEMDPFVAEVETFASGKHIGLLVPADGVMESGCATGRPEWPMQEPT